MFLAVGLNPVVEWLGRRGLRRSWSVLVVITVRAARGRAVPRRAGPGDHRPGRDDRQQRPRLVRPAPAQPAGPAARRPVRRDRQGPKDYVTGGNFGSALFGGVVGVGLKLLSFLANTFIVVVLTLYFLATLPKVKRPVYRLAPASRRDRVTELGDRILDSVGAYVSGAFVVALCAGISLAGLPVRRRPRRVRRRAGAVVALLDVIPMIGATIGAVIVTADRLRHRPARSGSPA